MTAAEFRDVHPVYADEPQRIAGRYRIHERIGSGRLGDIFSAVDEKYDSLGVGQHVAIQLLPEVVVRNNTLFNRLKAGYDALRATAHPNIVPYRHIGRDGNVGYLVMELLDGASLRRLLGAVDALPVDEVVPVIRGVGEALKLLHAKGLVHGNLTAGNIFITDRLEVRLLDIVPIGGAEAIFRGASMSGASGRCTVEDDVFALACLASEMLSGKHPYNHCAPAEARLAGRAPERIASLDDGEWEALRRALASDRTERTGSVDDFMREFGVRGTERLQSPANPPPQHEHITYPAGDEPVAVSPPVLPTRPAVATMPVAAAGTDLPDDLRRPLVEPVLEVAGHLRATLLCLLLVCLVAWTYYGQPDERMVELIGFVDESLDLGLAEPRFEAAAGLAGDPVAAVAADPAAPPGAPVAAAESPPVEPAAVTPAVVAPPVDSAATVEEDLAGPPLPADLAVPVDTAEPGDAAAAGDNGPASAADASATNANDAPVAAAPRPGLTESAVSVSERDGSVRITPPRAAGSARPLVWWTSEQTARADADFISVDQQQVADSPSVDVLHIPLVDDNRPEPEESFFVNFGRLDTVEGRIDRIATIRVDIVDDDSR